MWGGVVHPGSRMDGRDRREDRASASEELGCLGKGWGMKTKCVPPAALRVTLRVDSDGSEDGGVLPSGGGGRGCAAHRGRCRSRG